MTNADASIGFPVRNLATKLTIFNIFSNLICGYYKIILLILTFKLHGPVIMYLVFKLSIFRL